MNFDKIYAPIVGQSNGNNMYYFYDDDDSGASVLEQTLTSLTGVHTETQLYQAYDGENRASWGLNLRDEASYIKCGLSH